MSKDIEIKTISSTKEQSNRKELLKLYKKSPIPDNEKLANSGLFLKRQELSKILFFNFLYQKILDVQGVLMEFGVRWGQNLITLSNLRGIYEPYSYGRKIIGFDTFEGFEDVSDLDGTHPIIKKGAFSVTDKYEEFLDRLLLCHQNESPLNHINKFSIQKGNAVEELKRYLLKHRETIVAFAYFDLDIYSPTKECLKILLSNMPKGAIIAFDELLDSQFPGETIALKEVIELRQYSIKKNPFGGLQSYIILE